MFEMSSQSNKVNNKLAQAFSLETVYPSYCASAKHAEKFVGKLQWIAHLIANNASAKQNNHAPITKAARKKPAGKFQSI
jgi:hypothetical protein